MSRRNQSKKVTKKGRSNDAFALLPKGQAYTIHPAGFSYQSGPKITEFWVPGKSTIVQASSSVVNGTISLGTGLIDDFVARFSVIFQEYLIKEIRITWIPLQGPTSSVSGYLYLQMDEIDSSAIDTLDEAEDGNSLIVFNSLIGGNQNIRCITWRPKDLSDLAYTDTDSTVTRAYLKEFGNGNTIPGIGSSDIQGRIKIDFLLRFRGISDEAATLKRKLRKSQLNKIPSLPVVTPCVSKVCGCVKPC